MANHEHSLNEIGNVPLQIEVGRDFYRDPFGEELALYIKARASAEPDAPRVRYLCTNMTFTRVTPGVSRDSLLVPKITLEAAQRLMESLWDAGIRPSQAAGSIGQLHAVQAHLEDMRTLVFKGKPS